MELLPNFDTALRLAPATDRYVAYKTPSPSALCLIHDRQEDKAIDYCKPVYKTKKGRGGYQEPVAGWDGCGMAARKAAALNKAAAKAAAAAPQVALVAEVVVEVAPAVEPSYYPLHPATAPGADGELLTLAQLEENDGLLEASASGAQGGWVAVYLAKRQAIDVGGAQFAVVCEHHGNIGAAADIAQATGLLRKPAGFCPDCCGHLASQPATLEAGLDYWHREALVQLALINDAEADLSELVGLSDAALVEAAGFRPLVAPQ